MTKTGKTKRGKDKEEDQRKKDKDQRRQRRIEGLPARPKTLPKVHLFYQFEEVVVL
jgi:hypothetical protein